MGIQMRNLTQLNLEETLFLYERGVLKVYFDEKQQEEALTHRELYRQFLQAGLCVEEYTVRFAALMVTFAFAKWVVGVCSLEKVGLRGSPMRPKHNELCIEPNVSTQLWRNSARS
jgi:hypothetical protein